MHEVVVRLSDEEMDFLRAWPLWDGDEPPTTIADKIAFLVSAYRQQEVGRSIPEPEYENAYGPKPGDPEIPF